MRRLIRTTVMKLFGRFLVFTFDEYENMNTETSLFVEKTKQNSLVAAMEARDSVFPPAVNFKPEERL